MVWIEGGKMCLQFHQEIFDIVFKLRGVFCQFHSGILFD